MPVDNKIKRSPIHGRFCDCWDIKILEVNGKTHHIIGDKMSLTSLKKFLGEILITPSFMFTVPIEECEEKIHYLLDINIPVVIQTKTVIPEEIIEKMEKVKHSGIHVHIDSLRDFSLNSLDEGFSEVFALKQQLYLAKSWKIFTALYIDYKPHLLNRLVLFEIIELFRSCISHVLLDFKTIGDDDFRHNQEKWEKLVNFDSRDMKKLYKANVNKRAWIIKTKTVKEEVGEILEYLKLRKISIDILQFDNNTFDNKIKHVSYGLHKRPMGMRPFFYQVDEDSEHNYYINVPVKEIGALDYICTSCGKPIFKY